MITTLAGNNSYAIKRRLDELVAEFVKKYGDSALERIDGEEAEIQAIFEASQSLPFLAERKMVVLRNGSANKQLVQTIEQIISSVPESTDLVFYEPLTDKRTTFFKSLKAHSQFEEFNEMDAHSLANWLVGEASKQGGSLSLADANYLVQRLGQNQQLLASELEKLVTFDSQISRQTIDLLTEPTPQSKIFELLDQAFGGDKQKALALYADQKAQRVEPGAILAMIAWQLDILTIVKLAGDKQPAQIAKDAGLSPFPVTKASSLARKINRQKLEALVSDALEMDYKSKTREFDLDEALKSYIVII